MLKWLFGIVFVCQSLCAYSSQTLDKSQDSSQKLSQENTQNLKNHIDSTKSKNPLLDTLLNLPIHATKQWRTLLHYGKSTSSIHKTSPFFLDKKGHKNPKSEYQATLQKLFSQNLSSNDSSADSIACAYPARMEFIKRYITQNADIYDIEKSQVQEFLEMIDTSKCYDLQDFLDIVPLDKIFIEFAAESDIYPGSSMGHLYLHLQGNMQKDIQRIFDEVPFSRQKGQTQNYAMSYYATMSEVFNPLDYVRALVGNLKGYYALSPYSSTSAEYLNDESRSIYRYEVKTSKENLELFALHLWELKDKDIRYSFIKHNCTNGIEKILGVLDFANFYHSKKPFITPTQYLQYLHSQSKISISQVLLPERKKAFVEKFGANEVLDSYKNSKISIGYDYPNMAFLSFYPIYSSIKNADNSYKEFIESRLLSLQAGIAVRKNHSTYAKAFLSKIELLHLHSINDFARTRSLSKLINISFYPNLYNYDKNTKTYSKEPNYQTKLYPNVDLGVGFGAYIGKIAFFTLPFFSYRYDIIHNPALAIKNGFIAKIPRARLIAEHTLYYDIIKNNRGYDSKLAVFLGISVYKNVDIFVEGAWYHNLFTPHKWTYGKQFSYQRNEFVGIRSGVSVNF